MCWTYFINRITLPSCHRVLAQAAACFSHPHCEPRASGWCLQHSVYLPACPPSSTSFGNASHSSCLSLAQHSSLMVSGQLSGRCLSFRNATFSHGQIWSLGSVRSGEGEGRQVELHFWIHPKREIIHLETYLPLTEASDKILSLNNTGHLTHVGGAMFNTFVLSRSLC